MTDEELNALQNRMVAAVYLLAPDNTEDRIALFIAVAGELVLSAVRMDTNG